MTIQDLFHKYGTDKVEYAVLYHALLETRRQSVRAVLEVGIGTLIPDAHSSTRISILALARSQDTPPLLRIPRLFALNPAHHLRR